MTKKKKTVERYRTTKRAFQTHQIPKTSLQAHQHSTAQAPPQIRFQLPSQTQATFTGTGLQVLPSTQQDPGQVIRQDPRQFLLSYADGSLKTVVENNQVLHTTLEMLTRQGAQQNPSRAIPPTKLKTTAVQPKSKPNNTRTQIIRQYNQRSLLQVTVPVASSSVNIHPALESRMSLSPVYRVPTLYPVYFTYAAQHVLLVKVQELLEECCFDFAKRWIPNLLVRRGWETAVAGELSEWPAEIRKYLHQIPPAAIEILTANDNLSDIVFDVRHLRHIAVHRSHERAVDVLDLIRKGLLLTKTFKDIPRIAQLEKVLEVATLSLRDLESGKDRLEDRLADRLQEIQNEKDNFHRLIAECDRRAKDATVALQGQDTELRSQISKRLEDAMKLAFTIPEVENQPRGISDASSNDEAVVHQLGAPGSQGHKDVEISADRKLFQLLESSVLDSSTVSSGSIEKMAVHQQKNNHTKIQSADEPVWSCLECSRSFKDQTALDQHMKEVLVHKESQCVVLDQQHKVLQTGDHGGRYENMEDIDCNYEALVDQKAQGLRGDLGRNAGRSETMDGRIKAVSTRVEGIEQSSKNLALFPSGHASIPARRSPPMIGRTAVTVERRVLQFIDLTLDDETAGGEDKENIDDDEPQMFLRKRMIPRPEHPPTKRQKVEGFELKE